MAKRQQHRREFGSVSELPSGKWYARVTFRGRKYVKTVATENAANNYLDNLEKQLKKQSVDGADMAAESVADVANRWATRKTKEGEDKAYKTLVDYEATLRLHVLPFFEGRTIGELDGNHGLLWDYQEWLQTHIEDTVAARIKARGSSPTYARTNSKAQNYLNWVIEYARSKQAVFVNPYDHDEVYLPKKGKRREPLELLQENIDALEAAFGSYYGIIAQVDAYTGLRAGEVWALRRSSFNPLKNRLRISHSVQEQSGQGLVMGPTKNKQIRIVPLPDFLAEKLKAWVKEHPGGPNDWLFPTPTGEQVRHNNFMANVFKPALAKANLPASMRFHDLRHHCAHWNIDQGHEMYDIMTLLGHSSINVTIDVYGGYMTRRLEAMQKKSDTAWRANRASRDTVVTLHSPESVSDLVSV